MSVSGERGSVCLQLTLLSPSWLRLTQMADITPFPSCHCLPLSRSVGRDKGAEKVIIASGTGDKG